MKASNYSEILKGLLSTDLIPELIKRSGKNKENKNLIDSYSRLLLQICIYIPPSQWNGASSSSNMLQLLNEEIKKNNCSTSVLKIMMRIYEKPDQIPRGFSLTISYNSGYFTTVLHSLAESDDPTSVKELEGIVDSLHPDLNIKDSNGHTPLSIAIRNQNEGIYYYLMEHGGKIEDAIMEGKTELHLYSQIGDLGRIRKMIHKCMNVNIEDSSGSTPLYIASEYGHVKVLKYLVELGAEINKKNEWNETPLYLASGSRHLEVVEYLVEHGCNVNPENS